MSSETPKRLFFTIGGFSGTSYQVVWREGKLLYSWRPLRGEMASEAIRPEPEQWNAFWQELSRIDVWAWQGDFSDMKVPAGTSWALEIEHAGQWVEVSGMNAYPPGGKGPDMPPLFRRFLRALSTLMDGRNLI